MIRARLAAVVVMTLATLGGVTLPNFAAAQPMTEGRIQEIALQVAPPHSYLNRSRNLVWYFEKTFPGSRFVRLHFSEILDRSPEDYSVVIKDGLSRSVFTLPKAEFAGSTDLWTGVVSGNTVIVEIVASVPPADLRFTVKEIMYQALGQTLESYVGLTPLWEPVASYRADAGITKAVRSVAKVGFVRPDGRPDSCTGFLISKDRLVTNQHCVDSPTTCKSAIAIFGYESDANGVLRSGEQVRCARRRL